MGAVDKSLFSDLENLQQQQAMPVGSGVDTSLFADLETAPQQQPKGFMNMEPPGGKFEYPDTTKKAVRVAGGGVLKMAEGLVTLPFDIAAATGSEWDKDFSAKIRKHFPKLKPETTAESLGQTLVQYGVPATTAMKMVGGVLKGLPWAIRVVGDVLAGGLADVAVADPDEGTIGDITGGPTARKPGEGALKTRFKIGAEGTLIAGALVPPAQITKAGAKWVKTRVLPTSSMIMDAMSQTFRKMALDPDKAIANIQEGLERYSGSEFMPTTGTLSKDPGIIAFEKGATAQGKFGKSGPRMNERKQINLQHISDELERVTKEAGGDPEDAVRFFQTYLDNALTGKKDAYERTVKTLAQTEAETKNTIQEFADARKLEPEISTLLNDTATNELNKMTATKNELYRSIDPNHNVVIPKDRIRDGFIKMIRRSGPLDSTPSKIPAGIKTRFWKILKKAKKEKPSSTAGFIATPQKAKAEKPLTFGDVQDAMSDVSDAIAKARSDNQGGVVKKLTEFKKVLQKEAEYLEIEGEPGVAERVMAANKYYEEQYVPRFKKFIGNNFRTAIRKDKAWPASDFSKRFLGIKSGSTEAAQQLKLITSGADNAIQAQKASEDYIVGMLAEQLYGVKDSATAISKIDKFITQRAVRDTLKSFPGARKKLNDFRNGMLRRRSGETVLGRKVEEAQKFMKFTEREINLNAAKWFVDKDPIIAMRRVFDSPNPTLAMDQLLLLAKQDKSGKAKQGLRVALNNLIESPVGRGGVRGSQQSLSGKTFEVYSARLRNLLEYEPTKKAISKLYTPNEMKILGSMHEKIRVMDRINMQVTKGSPTSVLEQSVRSGQVLAFSIFGIVKGRGIFMVSRKIQEMLGVDPVEKAWQLLTDSMLDPKLAKTMLMKASEKNLPKIKAELTSHMVNNMITANKRMEE